MLQGWCGELSLRNSKIFSWLNDPNQLVVRLVEAQDPLSSGLSY
jgi:hypothetical protein